MWTAFFARRRVRSWDDASAVDTARYARFFRAMLERYPTRLNPGALWGGAKALYPSLESSARQLDSRGVSPGREPASS